MVDDTKPTARRAKSKRQSRLRFELLNAFVDSGMADLSRGELAVWITLYRDTRRDGMARTSVADLARRTGIDPRSVKRAIKSLLARKLIQRLRRGGLNRGVSLYRVWPPQGA
jgi:DNA-binding MarR family transcriptional regulator